MKFSVGLAATALAGVATAYPMVADMVADASLAERQEAPDPSKRFNAKQQYVSTTGEHRFIAPDFEGGDQRGPCPGLNAMANHGYLPRNGVGSHLDFVTGTFKAFGMSTDLSGFLTVLGATLEGNGLAWSIGGPSDALPGVGSLIGQPRGISGSHNNYECDVSPGRGDLYTHGNDFVLQMDQYQQLYDMAIANGDNIDLPLLTDFRAKRFNDSIANNPYFFNGPFTGVAVQPAAYTFIFRFMGNKSAEHPQGKLNTDIMNTFFGVEKKKNGKLVKKPGMERFPENWYKRAVGDEYSIPFFQVDLGLAALKYPQFLTVGGNQGKVNTFTGVNPKDLTGGVFNAKTLMKGNNAFCFATQFMKQALPDALKCSGVLGNIGAQMKKVTKQFDISLAQLSCPQLTSIDDSQFDKFPGYKNLNCKTGQYM